MYYFRVEVAEAAWHVPDDCHDASGNDSRRHRGGGESERPALRASHRQARHASAAARNCRASRSSSRSSATSMWILNSAPAC